MPEITERSGTVRFRGRGWTVLAWWLLAWNAAVPIRLVGMLAGPARSPAPMDEAVVMLILDQTSWALATYLMYHLALRARHRPLRQVLTVLGVLAVPLMVLRHWVYTASLSTLLGWPAPPPMRALWFQGPLYLFLLIAAAALGLLVVYMQRERDNAVLQANLQAELASARLQTLRLQLNPHFLFNALNSIASLVPSDAAKADTAIAALSSFLRASLSVTRGEETTLENELRLVDAYLEIEALRFEWLTVDLDVPDPLRYACVPAFVLQLLVENAIRHGLAPRRAPGRVHLAARRDGDALELCVTDDGVGLGAELSAGSGDSSLGIGLQNVRARLAQLYGSGATLTLGPADPQGTVATMRIPYRICPAEPVLRGADV
ncbi:MAG: histidine kinase [Gemmatimonadales bacterium]|nr:histidine kinase [Gemmatimonadales bacterium]